MRILLDAGHTKGINKGVCFYEGDNNYYYSLALKKELEKYGYKVDLTRNEIEENPTLATRQRMSDGYDLMLSIHSNAYKNQKVRGTELFDSVERPFRGLAEDLCEVTAKFFNHPNRGVEYKKRKDGRSYWAVLRGNALSMMLIEIGFHTNKEDCNIFLKNHVKLAQIHAETIARHLGVQMDWKELIVSKAHSRGLIKDLDLWLGEVNNPMPVWAVLEVLMNLEDKWTFEKENVQEK